MAASLFNGTAVKILKDILRFKSGIEVITNNSADPTAVAVNAPIGSVYIRSGTDDMYIKGDNGSTTTWRKVQDVNDVVNLVTGPASATDNAIVRYDLTTGKLIQNSSASISDTGVITAGADGVASLDLVTKQQLDASVSGVDVKEAALVATTANITLSGEQTIDGVLTSASRVLVKNQTTQSQNGVYVSAAGAWARAADSDTSLELDGALVTVKSGTVNANTGWYQTTDNPTVGTSNIVWNQFFGAGTYTADGQGIELTGSTFSLEIDGTTLSKSVTGLKVAALGVTNAEVSTTAGIARSKLASGTANRVAVNDGTGVLSDAAAITAARALVSDANGIPTHSAVTSTELGHVSGVTSALQTQIDGKVTTTGYTDLNLIGTADRDAEASIGNWAAYADAAASSPVDMTGGVPNTTITRTITAGEILRGNASFKITKTSGASRQGEGVSVSFTVPPSFQGKPVSIKIPFKVTSGSVVEGDFKAFIYDVTNSILITPFNNDIIGASGTLMAQFVSTASAATPANQTYRVGIHVASATNSSVNIVFDDVQVFQEQLAYGAASTNWESYTPTFAGLGAVTSIEMFRRRDGDSMEIRGSFTTGTADATTASMSLPSGHSTAGTGSIPSIAQFGYGYVGTAISLAGRELSVLATASQTVLNFSLVKEDSTVNPLIAQAGSTAFSNTTKYSFNMRVPIAGWESSNPLTSAQQFKISNYLVTGTRVTTTPSKLGEYRTYKKTASSVAGTDEAPTTGPSETNGMRIFGQDYASAGVAGATNRWEIFVGKNKSPKLMTYSTTGGTGTINTDITFGTTTYGLADGYDPVTGVYTVDAITQLTTTTGRFVGTTLPSAGGAIVAVSDCYFDVLVSEKINTVQLDRPHDYIHLDTGNGGGSTGTKIRRFLTARAQTTNGIISYEDSATNGASFTVLRKCKAVISYTDSSLTNGEPLGISKNASSLTTSVHLLNVEEVLAMGQNILGATIDIGTVATVVVLNAGDVIRAQNNGNMAAAARNAKFSIVAEAI